MPCELKQAASKSASQAEWHRIPLASDSKKAGKVDKSIGHLQMSAAKGVERLAFLPVVLETASRGYCSNVAGASRDRCLLRLTLVSEAPTPS
jgi:hypothetical protein